MIDKQNAPPLLRSDVSGEFRISRCEVTISVLSDLRTAEYLYSYHIERTAVGQDKWREVFAYPIEDFELIDCPRAGHPHDGNSARAGLEHQVIELGTPGRNACLLIDFDQAISVGGRYSFYYRCKTRIESVRNLSSLGGTGAIWYWCAHEYPVDAITVPVSLPRGVVVMATHPESPRTNNGATFSRGGLLPSEFVVALLTYEKRVRGIPVRYARVIEFIGAILIGVIGLLLANWIWRVATGG